MYSFKENLKSFLIYALEWWGAAVVLLISAVIFILVSLAITVRLPNDLTSPTTILIEPGESTLQIGEKLKENEVITSKWLFVLYTKLVATNKKLIAGEYEFHPGKCLKEIVQIISEGESLVRKLTIPEGYTVKQIFEIINNESRLSGAISDMPEEGTLFPDTFFFKYGDLRSKIYKAMQEKMRETIIEIIPQIDRNSPIDNIHKLLTLASIVEKEAGNDAEKSIIASVFLNRLKKNMKLQADPTVIYAVTNGDGNLRRPISKADLNVESPYNTYRVKGLPPGPIGCPGKKSINAVLKPAKTDYLYFVVDGKGGHNFSSNLEQHNKFVKLYRSLKSY